MIMFVDVAFPISSFKVFSYSVPPALTKSIAIGSRVNAPLGKRSAKGIVVRVRRRINFKGQIKDISGLVDDTPILNEALWELISWVSDYYLVPIGKAATAVLPSRFSTGYSPRKVKLVSLSDSGDMSAVDKRAPAQLKVLEFLSERNSPILLSRLNGIVSNPHQVCQKLSDLGLVHISKMKTLPVATGFLDEPIHKEISFNKEQSKVITEISSSIDSNKFSPFLLHGVTGSGKTEIYIEAARRVIAKGKSVIILLPEIALTPQIAGRFKSAFGSSVTLWHSKLGISERAWIWKKICGGRFKVVIGARSAVFMPLKNIGLIVMDEEQESSFKQESPDPRYHAREVALMRGKIDKSVVLLSSATPSIDSYFNQVKGKLNKLQLSKRFGGAKYPLVHVVDMNQELEEAGNPRFIFSSLLQEKIQDRLNKNEQVILLQNRRGHSPVVRCLDCGSMEMCPHCEVTLTYHKKGNSIQCHLCGFCKSPPPSQCKNCASDLMQLSGIGTQRVEDLVKHTFPDALIQRMDIDSAKSAKTISSTLAKFGNGEIDILLGTQMIAKGLDFENATLVGIINADTGLYLPDFRAGERVFQLIYQASGRAGRREKQGEVVIQTYSKDNPVIQSASKLDLKKYYNVLLNERKSLNYPPFSWIAKVEFSGKQKQNVESVSLAVSTSLPKPYSGLDILGPAYCYRERIRDNWRMQLVFKSNKEKDLSGEKLHAFIKNGLKTDKLRKTQKGVRITVDINPVSLL